MFFKFSKILNGYKFIFRVTLKESQKYLKQIQQGIETFLFSTNGFIAT